MSISAAANALVRDTAGPGAGRHSVIAVSVHTATLRSDSAVQCHLIA